ncbi:MAG: hypothetical protein LUH09_02225 [Clostridiales bacterium]|nr:hypothetical protein [Clostridiales bacterium]
MDYTLIAVSDEELQWLGILRDVQRTCDMMEDYPDAFLGRVRMNCEHLLRAYKTLIVAHDAVFNDCITHIRYE